MTEYVREWEDVYRALVNEVLRGIEFALQPFANNLDAFLAGLFSARLPGDWRERWHAFVAEQAELGFFVEPVSIEELETWIEQWAEYCELLPEAEDTYTPAATNEYGSGNSHHLVSVVENDDRSGRRSFVMAFAPNVSGPSEPQPTFVQGLEVAGPGPETTASFRAKVQLALETLDPVVARYWKRIGVQGLVRSRAASGYSTFWRFNVSMSLNKSQPIITVDQTFTAGQTAEAIVYELRYSLFAYEAGAEFHKEDAATGDPLDKFLEWRARSLQSAAGYASLLAELYINGIASIGPGGELVVTLNDVSENGLGWQQVIGALPMMVYFRGGIRSLTILIPTGVGKATRKIHIPEKLLKMYYLLKHEDQLVIVARASAVPDEQAVATIEREILAARRAAMLAKPPLPPPVEAVRVSPRKGGRPPDPNHLTAAESEERLVWRLHTEVDYEVVLRWGNKVTANGPDIVSYNTNKRVVTFWDDKYRSAARRIQGSDTLRPNSRSMSGAVDDARTRIELSALSVEDKAAALLAIADGRIRYITAGSGNAKNSVIGAP